MIATPTRSDRDRLLTGMLILNDGSCRLADKQRLALEAGDEYFEELEGAEGEVRV
jgi:hypothetical protein